METRAHHLMIGSFAIGISVMTVLFLMWIGKFEFNRHYDVYMLRFEGSVSGLGKAADVLYNGIKVGEVTELNLDPKDPSNVLVTIQVERTTPVRPDGCRGDPDRRRAEGREDRRGRGRALSVHRDAQIDLPEALCRGARADQSWQRRA